MLFPRRNRFRQLFELPAIWEIAFDPEDVGRQRDWRRGLSESQPIAVPASWNDQFAEWRDFLGPAWYQTRFFVPSAWLKSKIFLRFGSVNYLAEAWLNGETLGVHEGGHLPFEFDITEFVHLDENLLILRVDGRLGNDTVPPGNLDPQEVVASNLPYPNTSFDFFPFCGIQRPVSIYTVSKNHLSDITVSTDALGSSSILHIQWVTGLEKEETVRIHLTDGEQDILHESQKGEADIEIRNARLWSPTTPYLYILRIEVLEGDKPVDSYSLPVGVRTISVEGDTLLLNGKPVYLRGFGRHEDFPVYGRGYAPPVIVKDFDLMRWVGANSFRTSHYPYAEEQLDLADRLGFLVIDETPAVGLFFKNELGLKKRNALCRQMLREIIQRDRNHPSVIMWSLANEPRSDHSRTAKFFRELYDLAYKLDGTRPVTVARHARMADDSYEFLDVISLNLYYGWYQQQGQLQEGFERLRQELENVYRRFRKPVLLTEFGADALPGHHAQPPEMFSEEYQAALLEGYLQVLKEIPYVVGKHIWNLCDFKTGQAVHRMQGMNYKGIFTRDRRPKLAAHRVRKLWKEG